MSIVEQRSYTLHTQFGPKDYFDIYQAEGFELQTSALKGFQGYFITEIGGLNTIVSLWSYPSFEARAQRRAALASDPGWQQFLAKVRPMIKSMTNTLMVPTPFSPIQ